jgi:hypothetical protein
MILNINDVSGIGYNPVLGDIFFIIFIFHINDNDQDQVWNLSDIKHVWQPHNKQ